MAVPSPARRRLVSVPALVVAWILLVGLAPIGLPIAVLVDLGQGRWRLRWARIYALLVLVVTTELVMLGLATGVGLVTVGGRLLGRRRWWAVNFWFQQTWVRLHLTSARVTCRLRLVVENLDEAADADAIVVARHISHADALFPAYVWGTLAGHELRYTLKEELQWPPAMDIVGNRLPHVWVDRTPAPGSPVLERMRIAAGDIGPDVVGVIFPEGTFFTPARLARAVTRLERTRPDLAERAVRLRHLLPPRPAGTTALLEGAPDADVVIMGNEGLESFSSIRDIVDAVPLRAEVRIRLWRHPRAAVPDDPAEQATWLLDQWLELDAWVEDRLVSPPAAEPAARSTEGTAA